MSFSPGDINLYDFTMSGAGGSVDVRRRVRDFSIYESIKTPYISIVAKIIDNTDMLNQNLGMNGNNNLTVSFGQPGQNPYNGTFKILEVEKGRTLENQRTAEYTITGYSPHMTNQPKVQKAYREVPATQVAQDLIQTVLNPSKGILIGAPSRGLVGNAHMPYNINGVNIHKAIRSILSRAASSVDESSAYLFFENQKNMVIDTLENLMSKAVGSPVATFIQRPMGQNFLRDVAIQPFVILAMREEARVSATDNILNNNQATNIFDLFSNQFKKGNTANAATYLNIPYNMLRPPTFIADFLNKRKKIAGQFDSQSATIQVSLNTDVTVGGGFSIETLAPAGDTDTPILDAISGPMLATEVRHTVNLTQKKMQGLSTIKGTKGNQNYLG